MGLRTGCGEFGVGLRMQKRKIEKVVRSWNWDVSRPIMGVITKKRSINKPQIETLK